MASCPSLSAAFEMREAFMINRATWRHGASRARAVADPLEEGTRKLGFGKTSFTIVMCWGTIDCV